MTAHNDYDRIFGALKDTGVRDIAFTFHPEAKGDVTESTLRVLDDYLDGNVVPFGKIGDSP